LVDLGPAARSRLVSVSEIGPFSWPWPEGTETYDRGWAAVADVDGIEFRLRHGIARRDTFGRTRLKSVTWVEGEVFAEGTEADDFDQSESLVSLIKITKKHLRPGDNVPPEYAGFVIVVFAEEVVGPYSYGSLAVKQRFDDIEGWTRHALLRAAAWSRLSGGSRYRRSLPSRTAPGPLPAATHDSPPGEQQAIATALLEYGSHHDTSEKGAILEFTANEEANGLLRSDPFAFLLRVLFDQNVPYERAWLAPFFLKQRLGHLDPQIIAHADGAARSPARTELPPSTRRSP
jgi:hypothetical protein